VCMCVCVYVCERVTDYLPIFVSIPFRSLPLIAWCIYVYVYVYVCIYMFI